MRIRIRLITLMQIRILTCIEADANMEYFFVAADADPTFHPDADPDPGPCFQTKAQILVNSNHWLLSL
jgi:hypothetical protein